MRANCTVRAPPVHTEQVVCRPLSTYPYLPVDSTACIRAENYGVPFVSKLHFSHDLVNNATDLLNNGY